MISILTALNSEAKAFIDHFSLGQEVSKPFAYYTNKSNDVEVLVTGIGGLAMAAAIGWLGGARPSQRVWLNVGIAGHSSKPLGDLVLVHGCADALDASAHYPPLVAAWPPKVTAACLSYNAPCRDYPGDALVDMEAHSFFTTARKFSSSEFVQSVKVVSDNQTSSIDQINAQMIQELIKPHTHVIVNFAQALDKLKQATMVELQHGVCIAHVRLTHSQAQQADALLNKAMVLGVLSTKLRITISQCARFTDLAECLTEVTRLQSPVLTAAQNQSLAQHN